MINNERGVALITVLFIGAALTAVASVAAFTTVRELRAGTDDRRASEALAIAEGGIDRFIDHIASARVNWGDLRLAGCDAEHPPLTLNGTLGAGTFNAEFRVYNPSAPPAERLAPGPACVNSPTNPRSASPRVKQFFAITSTGSHPSAKRIVRQVVRIGPIGLPVGIYADNVQANGSGDFSGISLLSPNDIEGRDKMAFSGTDPYYLLSDFWPSMSGVLNIPAAIHTTGGIYMKKILTGVPLTEHPPALNCDANPVPQGTRAQSMWDQSGQGGAIAARCTLWAGSPSGPDLPPGPDAFTFPPTSKITTLKDVVPRPSLSDQDYLALKNSAQRDGLYCFISALGARSCTLRGGVWTPTGAGFAVQVSQTDVNQVLANINDFVAYFEYQDPSKAQAVNDIVWEASVGPCSDTLSADRSAVIVIRNGSYDVGAGGYTVNGLLLAPEGDVRLRGGHVIHGTIIAKRVDIQGTAEFQLDPCWVRNMPGPFLDVTPSSWSEIDR